MADAPAASHLSPWRRTWGQAQAALQSRTGRQLTRLARWALIAGVIAFLATRLGDVGWQDVWAALPTHPLFYALFLALYLAPPLMELPVFRTLWGFSVARSWPVFVRKRVYNAAVLGYSGDVLFYAWAREVTSLPARQLASTIKDNAILAAMASNLATLALLAAFLLTGQMAALAALDATTTRWVGLVALISLALMPLFALFYRQILGVGARVALIVFSWHAVRQVLVLALQVAAWMLLFPQVEATTWLVFLTAQMMLSRVPGLPNQDLLFLALGVSLSGVVDAPLAAVVAMFVATGVLTQAAHLLAYVATSFGRFEPRVQAP
jgi:hypothetical protein